MLAKNMLLLTFFSLILSTSAGKTKGDPCSTNFECGPDLVCSLQQRDEPTKKCSDYFLQEKQCCYGDDHTFCHAPGGTLRGYNCKQIGESYTSDTCSALCDIEKWCISFVFGSQDKANRGGECWLQSECDKIYQPCDNFDTYYRIKDNDGVKNCMKNDLEHKIKKFVQIEYENCADQTFANDPIDPNKIVPNDPKDFNKACPIQGKASLKGCGKNDITEQAKCAAKNDGSASYTYYRGWKIPDICVASCKKSDLEELYIGRLKIEYAYCDGPICDTHVVATVKSCVGLHYAIQKNAQPAICSWTYTDISPKHYMGWEIPDSFTCIDLDKGDTSIHYHASTGDIIVLIVIATIAGLFVFLGIGYVIYYCYLNYCPEEL